MLCGTEEEGTQRIRIWLHKDLLIEFSTGLTLQTRFT